MKSVSVSASAMAAQFPRSDSTKKVRVAAADIAVGQTPGHAENDEPFKDRKKTLQKRRIMRLKALQNQQFLQVFAGREPQSTRKRGIWQILNLNSLRNYYGFLLQKLVRIQEGFTVEPL